MTDTYSPPVAPDGTVLRHAWPGLARIWYVTADGAYLCAECVEANRDQTVDAPPGTDDPSSWQIVGHVTEAEDVPGPCAHCYRTAGEEDDRG